MLATKIIDSVLSPQTEQIFIAYSGGIDSHVLLHLASLNVPIKSKITAIYVHHGLQQEADDWLTHCEKTSLDLGVKFQYLKVNAQKYPKQSPEEAARDARYQALKKLLAKNDVLLFAQHREDQMETVLLQLFRGAGTQGLAGMPWSIAFGSGSLCRPFLDTSNQDIRLYAKQHKLQWIEDPSNKNNDLNRNFLRNQILPQLKQRWPALDKTISRSARHCANSQKVTQKLAQKLLDNLADKTDQTLNISQLLVLELSQQQLVIRQWFKSFQLRMPTENNLQRILTDLVLSSASGNPEVRSKHFCIRRYRNKLFCLKIQSYKNEAVQQEWPVGQQQLILHGGQTLKIVSTDQGIAKTLWLNSQVSVRFRKGAEKIRLLGRDGHHSLKKLFQEQAIPPWERNYIPLIYLNDQLAIIAGLWISADFLSIKKEPCYQIVRGSLDD